MTSDRLRGAWFVLSGCVLMAWWSLRWAIEIFRDGLENDL